MPRIVDQLAPLSCGIAITLLCLVLKENFPFTHYPMYSDFSDQSYYVWLGDSEGKPIAVQNLTGLRTGRIKKVYNNGLQEVRQRLREERGSAPRKRDLTLDQRRGPGEATLEWLYAAAPEAARPKLDAAAPLRLYQVDIRIDRWEVVETAPELVAELPLP